MTVAEYTLTTWSSRPLCRRYVLCIPSTVVVRWREAGCVREREVHWLFGWLADGECEPLGAWMGPLAFQQMRADLRNRGAQRIWHVALLPDAQPESEGAACAVELVSPGAMTSSLPAVWPVASAVAEDVGQTLERAVRRHGHFENAAAALDFVSLALLRAERRLDRERLLARQHPPLASGVRMAPPASDDATMRASGGQE